MLTFGQWIDNKDTASLDDADGATIDIENPTDGSIVGKVPAGGPKDAQAALQSAARAQPAWAKVPAKQRAQVLKDIAQIIRDNRDALAETLLMEQAKVEGLAQVEVDATAAYFDMYAGSLYSFPGEIVQSDSPDEKIYLHYAPIGVSVGIAPW